MDLFVAFQDLSIIPCHIERAHTFLCSTPRTCGRISNNPASRAIKFHHAIDKVTLVSHRHHESIRTQVVTIMSLAVSTLR